MPWSPIVPLTSTRSPGRTRCGPRSTPGRSRPMPVVLRNSPSAAPRGTTLVSPVTTATPQPRRRLGDAADDPPQRLQRQALLDDQAQAQVQRLGAADGQVVDRRRARPACRCRRRGRTSGLTT